MSVGASGGRPGRRQRATADDWWALDGASDSTSRPVATPAPRNGGRRQRSHARRPSVVARVVRTVARRLRASDRLRRYTVVVVVAGMTLAAVAFAVLVIMLNNLIIKRSAELGELDTRRRELRTENALLSAEIARLSAPPLVTRIAKKRLGMIVSPEMAKFIYVDPANQPMTAERRRRLERRALRRQRQRERRLLQQQRQAQQAASGTTAGARSEAPAAATAEGRP